jgi:glycosyltransferase involved in cell wall biosynthesis
MKILHIATHFGTTTVYNNLFAQLKALGHMSTYIVSHRNHDYTALDGRYTQLIHLHFLYKLFSAVKAKLFGKHLLVKGIKGNFEVIHAHTVLADGLLALFIKKHLQPNCKLLVTVRSTDLKYRFRLMPWERPAFKKVLNAANVITVLSPAYRDRLLQIDKRWASKIKVVPNGLAENMSVDGAMTAVNDSKDFLFVGRMIPRKNLHKMLLAYRRLRGANKEVGALYIVGGNGPGWYGKIVRYLAGLTQQVEFIGPLPQQAVYEYMKQCKVLVAPSFSETFGLVYLEALANHMVVIGSKGEGVAGYFNEAQGFYLANPNSVKSIFECLQKADAFTVRTPVDLTQFSWPRVAAAYSALYPINLKA